MMQELGIVAALNIFPVKSMQGIAVEQAKLWWYGVDGDRKCAFVRSDNPSGFPWLTGRQVADMVRYQPIFTEPDNLLRSAIRVKTPSGDEWPLEAAALQQELAAAYGHDIHLMNLRRGTFDCMPISLITTNAVDAIGQALGRAIDVRRFRMNIVVAPASRELFPEDAWCKQILAFGDRPDSAHVWFDYKTERCAMITIDPDTAQRDYSIQKWVADVRDDCVGIYGTVRRLGTVQVGDVVRLVPTAE